MMHYQAKVLSKVFKIAMVLLFLSFCLPPLGHSETRDRVDRLIQELGSFGAGVQRNAIEALVEMGRPAVKPLIAALKDRYSQRRQGAAVALGEIGDPRAVEPLITIALGDEDEEVRWAAAGALGRIKDPRAVEPLIAALRDEDRRIREGAARTLGKIKDPRAVKPLIVALRDEDPDVRRRAARALGWIKNLRAVTPLVAVLRDEDRWVRRRAAKVLGEIGDPRAVEPLIAALRDEKSSWVHVVRALERITGKAFGRDPVKWQEWWEENKEAFLKER